MRKLASIQKILSLEPIEGADNIEKATILGWQLVVKKGEFGVGDLCLYLEIDSLIPIKPEFEFLRKSSYRQMSDGTEGFRIRTVKLKKQISQGIAFPLSILKNYSIKDSEIIEGIDVTNLLGIVKYDPPIPAQLSGKIRGNFPGFLRKTDETRVQLLQDILNKYKGTQCYISEKIDGSSVSFYLYNDVFGVCSRNLDLLEDDTNSFWKVARQLDIENKLNSICGSYSLQGELIGEGIQKNKLKIKGQTIRFFNAFNINTQEYLSFEDFSSLMKKLDLITVPIISSNYILENDINSIISLATRKSILCPDIWAEGIVIRPLIETIEPLIDGCRLSFKAINPEFLLKYDD